MVGQLRVRDVFIPGGQPTITYVDRANLGLERRLAAALERGHTLVAVTGPTKSGKTVLCRRIVGENSIWVEGGQIRSEEQIWAQAAYKLNVPDSVMRQSGQDGRAGIGANLGVSAVSAKAELSATHSTKQDVRWDANKTVAVIDNLKRNDVVLVVDDFHYLAKELQSDFIQSVKSAIFDGMRVVLLSVPHRAYEPIAVQNEMQGRFVHVNIPTWSSQDLLKISELGFNALGVSCKTNIMQKMVKESCESPILMQRFCADMCGYSGIKERCDPQVVLVNQEETLQEIFKDVSQDAGFPIYQRLSKGPQSRKERVKRRLRTGEVADIYQAILRSIAATGPRSRLTYDEIRAGLRELMAENPPQKHEVTSALKHMSRIAAEEIQGEPAIDWDQDTETINITDPFLLFYMRWFKLEE